MPIKYNLTKHDMLAERIHKLAAKDDTELTTEENELKIVAIIATSLSENHAWRTHQAITNGTNDFSSKEIRDEFFKANMCWKQLKSQDLQDLAGKNIPDHKFYSWMHQTVGKDEHEKYKQGWLQLNMEFDKECDDINAKS